MKTFEVGVEKFHLTFFYLETKKRARETTLFFLEVCDWLTLLGQFEDCQRIGVVAQFVARGTTAATPPFGQARPMAKVFKIVRGGLKPNTARCRFGKDCPHLLRFSIVIAYRSEEIKFAGLQLPLELINRPLHQQSLLWIHGSTRFLFTNPKIIGLFYICNIILLF